MIEGQADEGFLRPREKEWSCRAQQTLEHRDTKTTPQHVSTVKTRPRAATERTLRRSVSIPRMRPRALRSPERSGSTAQSFCARAAVNFLRNTPGHMDCVTPHSPEQR